jgi:hypothetical protein
MTNNTMLIPITTWEYDRLLRNIQELKTQKQVYCSILVNIKQESDPGPTCKYYYYTYQQQEFLDKLQEILIHEKCCIISKQYLAYLRYCQTRTFLQSIKDMFLKKRLDK